MSNALLSQGYTQSKNDYSLFIKKSGSHITIVAVYVDDILVTGSDLQAITHLKDFLHQAFTIKDLGILHYLLGLEVHHLPNGIVLSQIKFTQDLLEETGFLDTKPTITPLPLNMKLLDFASPFLDNPSKYRCLIGKLNFLTHTRPDLSFVVQTLSQYMQKPQQIHLEGLHHLLKYLKGISGQGILLKGSSSINLHAYSDSDWTSCPISRRSVTGYMVLFGGSPISWKSKKQSTIARSSSEAKYRVMAHAAAEVAWLVRLLEELGGQNLKPVTLHCDN